VDAIERAQALLDEYAALVQAELPEGADVFDAHTHLGTDIDGMVGDLDELLDVQRRAGISRSFVFCLDEPDRHPGFRAANDRTLDYARRSDGALIPFVRLDLNEGPLEEAVRCLDRGARGIKLHPRAQRFLPDDPRLEPVFAVASERSVPILIHGGRGLPPIADSLARLVDRFSTTLIIAHAGIVDLAALARHFSGRGGVFFDTSVWSPLDLLDLYRLVSPQQVLYASDFPYGRQPNSLLMAIRTARASGLDNAELRTLLAESAQRIADNEPPLPLSPPRGRDEVAQPVTFARIHQYLSMAATLLWTRQQDTIGLLGLALNACDERSNGHVEATDRIRQLLEATRDLWTLAAESDDEAFRIRTNRGAFRLLHLANILTVTSA
jgi:predicted TIM-barrel fold metal-dependent hydrolase